MPSSLYILHGQTPYGDMLLCASETALAGAWFLGQKNFPRFRLTNRTLIEWEKKLGVYRKPQKNELLFYTDMVPQAEAILQKAYEELLEYFSGKLQQFSVPFAPIGTNLQQTVWQSLLRIPYGTTQSYSDLAASIGKPNAVRAVAGAVGKNPLSVFIPCHRIIGKDGSLVGYAGGVQRKQGLLRLEQKPAP